MTRKIEFRAWDKKWKTMTAQVNLNHIKEGFIGLFGDDKIVMQFTGLFDKNGVKIFEGDIIQFTYWWFDGEEQQSILTGELIYSEDSISFQLKGVRNSVWEKHNGYQDDCEYLVPFATLNFDEADFEVIGNIYQHPELINKEQND